MIILLDNFDSFTYNLVDYFKQLGLCIVVLRNDVQLEKIIALNPQAIVLSPGHGTPKKAGIMMEVIAYYYNKIPILGICLGHQALGEFFGATLAKAQKPMHGKISTLQVVDNEVVKKNKLFQDLPKKFSIVRYHSLIIQNDSPDLTVLAYTEDGEIMAFQHKTLPICGLQFHPEAILTEFGLDILRNWKNLISYKS
jgi:anthranilate synthase component 2